LLQAYSAQIQQHPQTLEPATNGIGSSADSRPASSPAAAEAQGSGQQQLQDTIHHLQYALSAAAKPPPSALDFQSHFLHRRWCRSNMRLAGFMPAVDQVPRVQHSALDRANFATSYDLPGQLYNTGAQPALLLALLQYLVLLPVKPITVCSRCRVGILLVYPINRCQQLLVLQRALHSCLK
jgi:hypothetical protein